jgi:hypothetical protein
VELGMTTTTLAAASFGDADTGEFEPFSPRLLAFIEFSIRNKLKCIANNMFVVWFPSQQDLGEFYATGTFFCAVYSLAKKTCLL